VGNGKKTKGKLGGGVWHDQREGDQRALLIRGLNVRRLDLSCFPCPESSSVPW
jgi:hypothetical protein